MSHDARARRPSACGFLLADHLVTRDASVLTSFAGARAAAPDADCTAARRRRGVSPSRRRRPSPGADRTFARVPTAAGARFVRVFDTRGSACAAQVACELGLAPGAVVIESGTGSGAMSSALARCVARPAASRYVLDISADDARLASVCVGAARPRLHLRVQRDARRVRAVRVRTQRTRRRRHRRAPRRLLARLRRAPRRQGRRYLPRPPGTLARKPRRAQQPKVSLSLSLSLSIERERENPSLYRERERESARARALASRTPPRRARLGLCCRRCRTLSRPRPPAPPSRRTHRA